MKIAIHCNSRIWEAEIYDTVTGKKIFEALPLKSTAHTWGDEIYFDIPVQQQLEAGAKEELDEGDLAYWPQSPVFCIFFGPTPASTGTKPVAYSAVNVFGKIHGELAALKAIKAGDEIVVEKA